MGQTVTPYEKRGYTAIGTVMGQKWTRVLLFSGKPLATNMVLCCTENLCDGTKTAPHGAHPLYRLSTASQWKIYQSEKRKVIGRTTLARLVQPRLSHGTIGAGIS